MNTLINNHENTNILDLPNEMLLAIMSKLSKIDVLYSLVGVNRQFDQLIIDPFYIHDLDFTRKLLFDDISPIDKQTLDRICGKILPRINDKVNKLTVEPLSIERIFHAVDYAQLYSLSLVNFSQEILLRHIIDNAVIHRLMTEQITCLNIQKLPQLKCFSLASYQRTCSYDSRIVPLLRRMPNIEELTLFLSVIRMESTYIDGIHLHDEILIHVPRLDKLLFSITTILYNINAKIELPSNDDIQRGFIEKEIYQVDSYVINDPSKVQQECRIYSKSYPFNVFSHLTSGFPGGKFDDFPFLKKLALFNTAAQQNKRCSLPFITFPHLVEPHVHMAHTDYAEQFLYERNAHLPCLSSLEICYETLSILTNNFTNDVARVNCDKLQRLVIK
ncbi:unnamed protein product [Rotaria magnacalcarata]|uniref:F-box domain-containing protein n=1 Tax=Rotaria magnacalcarata TaxID=392030 RepID=A0A816A667_9BILA|nr:unnamed protein product [Rotaria magnacalcarata]